MSYCPDCGDKLLPHTGSHFNGQCKASGMATAAPSPTPDESDELGFVIACEVCGQRVILRTQRDYYLCPRCAEVADTDEDSDDDAYPLGQVQG